MSKFSVVGRRGAHYCLAANGKWLSADEVLTLLRAAESKPSANKPQMSAKAKNEI